MSSGSYPRSNVGYAWTSSLALQFTMWALVGTWLRGCVRYGPLLGHGSYEVTAAVYVNAEDEEVVDADARELRRHGL